MSLSRQVRRTMTDVNSKMRLSPPLMQVFRSAHEAKDAKKKIDVLNESGERIIAGRRLRARHVVTEPVLRREVWRDLDAVLNTVALESTIDLVETPYVRKSILNFGIPDVAHRTIDEAAVTNIPDEIKEAILNYEPRLAAGSVQIERDMSVDPAELKVRFIVRADLTCDPVHVPVEFVADIIDTGKIVVRRL
jgi:type VI secretion system protein ImpF